MKRDKIRAVTINNIKTGQILDLNNGVVNDHNPIPERRVQRTVSLNQQDNNPVQLDQNMLHNKTVNEAYEGRIPVLTQPRPNIRGRKRSNSVKERQMYYP